jgi:hypothetical protein
MTQTCTNAEGHPKATYPSERAAKHALERSPRWRLRKTWPSPFKCPTCHQFHLGHPKADL